ncbi:hypothetical protein [Haloferula sp. BvORR071]|uniref:hypothetical protein n=1 Tax=Haloferula sp. BvORR071 TaxID=1396141 RepID=UPI000554A328|nr:hypothetical protein [Haloferula sp. BvORR071]
MAPLSPRHAVTAASAALLLLTAAAHAVQPFGHIIRKNDASLPAFTSAGMATHEGFTGAAFYASMNFPNGANTYPVAGFGYFDQNAAFKWAAYIETGPLAGYYPTIAGPLPSNPAKYFAIYNLPGGKTRVGVGNGSTLAKDFAYEFSHTANPDETVTALAPGDKILQLMDQGSTLSLVSFTPNGNLDISKNYSSPLFLPAVAAGEDDPQFASISSIADGSGHYVCVQNSSNGVANTFILINLDGAGAVRWARTFAVNAGTSTLSLSPALHPAPDGSYILTLTETGFDLGTFTYNQKTHLIKFNANGSKAWATSITGASLNVDLYSPNGNDVWLTGSKVDLSGGSATSQPLAVRLSNATGQIAAEFRPSISAGVGAMAYMIAVNADAAYFNIYDTASPTRSLVAKVPAGTNTVQGFVRNDTFNNGAMLSMRDTTGTLSSEFGDGLRVIGYNPSFQSVIAACPDYAANTITLLPAALTAQALTIDPQATTITATARTTTLTPVTLPIHALALKIDPYQASSAPLKLAVTTTRNAAGNLLIGFTAQAGVKYTLLHSPDMVAPFQAIQTLNGTGAPATFTITDLSARKGFFKISDDNP